jgi:hypothetical protein
LADGLEKVADRLVMTFELRFQFGEFSGKLALTDEHFAQLHESANDCHAHGDRSGTAQNARQHRDALFGEDTRWFACTAVSLPCFLKILRNRKLIT